MVYVGDIEYPYRRMLMSHMLADTLQELHEMADSIGIDRKWFQNKEKFPHYDVCKSMKQKAIQLGAVEMSDRELVRMFLARNCEHEWEDVHNGTVCKKCATFYAEGCAPWDPLPDGW